MSAGIILSQPTPTVNATVLCCNCGAPIDGTLSAGALCHDCLKLSVDITHGVPREATLHVCRDCERWFSPPTQWIVATLESRELLSLCLRKLRGLSKTRVIDASFTWTEPHSRRVKVNITVQQEALQGAIIQQSFQVEYVVANQQCPDCAKSYTHNAWRAVVQIRQKVVHKRTFLFLEQLILKHGAHSDTINIKEVDEGIDFFFQQRNHAEKFVDFLTSVAPVRVKKSKDLISTDIHTSTKSYKFSYSCELVPVCRDDLVALPMKLAKQIGDISPLALCYRIGTSISVIDPSTLRTADISASIYWRTPFTAFANVQELVEFIIMDIEVVGPRRGRFAYAEATVARASDLSANNNTYFARTHLGEILRAGDSVLGYDISNSNFNNPTFEALEESKQYGSTIPDVILVKKVYARRRKNKTRNWRLKRMDKEESEMLPRRQDQNRTEQDFELFLRDVEEDTDLRSMLQIYKSGRKEVAENMDGIEEAEPGQESEDERLEIPMDQLLDELEGLKMQDDA